MEGEREEHGQEGGLGSGVLSWWWEKLGLAVTDLVGELVDLAGGDVAPGEGW